MMAQSLDCVDVLVKIFAQLPPVDVARCALTCRIWHKAASDSSLWRHLCMQRWASLSDPGAGFCLPRLCNFTSFYSQRASSAPILSTQDAALFLLHAPSTLFLDVFLAGRPIFSVALAGSSLVKDRLRFKLPLPLSQSGEGSFQHLLVQLSAVRHADGCSACLVNGYPSSKSRTTGKPIKPGGGKGLNCVLVLIDDHSFLNFYW